MRIWYRSLLGYLLKISGIFYKSPINFNYWFNFGFLSLYFLISQIITGIIIAMFYNANSLFAFGLILDMSNEIYYGWWLRYIHANGASFFFFCVYVHMFRGMYYGSFVYPRQYLWLSGSIIWVLMIATAFMGYVLPWGQMSFWGAMVITSLVGAVPLIGSDLLFLLWGSYSIDNVTLHRFYSLHYLLPFIIFMVSMIHLALLHEFGSNNPLGISVQLDNAPFIPYYGIKDVFSIFGILFVFFIFVCFFPDKLGHSDNYIMANSLITPPHIVPEWYFLVLYAVLRSVPNKLLGLFLIAAFIVCIVTMPFICKWFSIRSTIFRPLYGIIVWFFFFVFLSLGWIGGLPVLSPFLQIGQIVTFLYFFILLIMFPAIGYFDDLVYYLWITKNNG
jgi:quinol-cytochrome oxidoreductase complex cytochrome b subunit